MKMLRLSFYKPTRHVYAPVGDAYSYLPVAWSSPCERPDCYACRRVKEIADNLSLGTPDLVLQVEAGPLDHFDACWDDAIALGLLRAWDAEPGSEDVGPKAILLDRLEEIGASPRLIQRVRDFHF